MGKLRLSLYPSELLALLGYLRLSTAHQQHLPPTYQPLEVLIMLGYLASWTPQRLQAWRLKRPDKTYSVSIPLAVAKALHQHMQATCLDHHQQLLLARLDQAMINYRDPFAGPHAIGSLISASLHLP